MKLIDPVIELVNARVPLSSRDPGVGNLGMDKTRMILLNKSDLADERQNTHQATWFEDKGIHVMKVDARDEGTLKQVQFVIQEAYKEKIEENRHRGILNRPMRTMVVRIPNMGKSTFINSLAGKACAGTGNKPDVTKGNQWIRLNKVSEFLDALGILRPKFEDQQTGLKLTLIGSINDQTLNKDELTCKLICFLKKHYPQVLAEWLDLETGGKKAAAILEEIARVRVCLLEGEDLNVPRVTGSLLDNFRTGKLGRTMLEKPKSQRDRME